VIIFPETVVPTWTAATDAFWQQTLDRLRSSGKTILVGARVPLPSTKTAQTRYDFSADLAALSGTSSQVVSRRDSTEAIREPSFAYENSLILRGAESGLFRQRIPVPVAMCNPLKTAIARLNLSGAGIINIQGERAAILICYEQLLIWPVLASMAERPTVLIAIANNHWTTGTPIPRFQLAAVRAWARLFRLPYLSAVNT
jgi:apolipoprotein N-acyltransferase